MRWLPICGGFWLVAVLGLLGAPPVSADITVTLAPREFLQASPAAVFREAFNDGRRQAAATTPVWSSSTDDLSAWGPALVFPLLDAGLPNDTVLALAEPLQAEAVAPRLLWLTLGLYAAKNRVPCEQTPQLLAAVRRNLRTINRAVRHPDALVAARSGLKDWGAVGLEAWVAYLNLLFRDYWDLPPRSGLGGDSWNSDGLEIVNRLLASARLAGGAGFHSDPRSDELRLWPNALMLYALVKAYENEELVHYETAAIETAAALEALRDSDGAYFSSAAKTHKDPIANAWLCSALLLLAKDSGDAGYRDRAVGVLRWLVRQDPGTASLKSQIGYLILLLDSLATRPNENLLGKRPMCTAPTTPSLPLAELRAADFRYRPMFDGVLQTLVHRLPQQEGDFAYDYGDSPGYAVEVLLAAGQHEPAREALSRQQQMLAWPRPADLSEISFGTRAYFTALAHPELFGRAEVETALRRLTLLSGALAIADRYYMDWLDWFSGGGGYDYGPTVIGAQIAESQLQFAAAFPQQRVGWLIDPASVGKAVISTAGAMAWNQSRRFYDARPPRDQPADEIWLLPNAMMVLACLEAHALTGEQTYLERSESVIEGLEKLWDPRREAYFASSTLTGADGYLSLSTNSYAALALHRLGVVTGKQPYRQRARAILDFFQRDLYRGGVVYHHVYRGRPSAGDIWCPGCNWRVLSMLREVEGDEGRRAVRR